MHVHFNRMHFIIDNDLLKKSKALKYICIPKIIFIASLALLLKIKLRFPKEKLCNRVIGEIFIMDNAYKIKGKRFTVCYNDCKVVAYAYHLSECVIDFEFGCD